MVRGLVGCLSRLQQHGGLHVWQVYTAVLVADADGEQHVEQVTLTSTLLYSCTWVVPAPAALWQVFSDPAQVALACPSYFGVDEQELG